MAWFAVPAVTAALGAYSSGRQASAQQDAEKRNMLANAEALRYSPWTGMNPGMQKSSGVDAGGAALTGGLGGALSGAQFMNQFQAPSKPEMPMAQNQEEYSGASALPNFFSSRPRMMK